MELRSRLAISCAIHIHKGSLTHHSPIPTTTSGPCPRHRSKGQVMCDMEMITVIGHKTHLFKGSVVRVVMTSKDVNMNRSESSVIVAQRRLFSLMGSVVSKALKLGNRAKPKLHFLLSSFNLKLIIRECVCLPR